ncbi:hypothetical protein ANCDUO_22217, partial [Ancylostoma duodenale]
VQEAISKNLKGRTVVLIAHRLSTVENADKIVVINRGRVEQMGTHKELINQEGMYKLLVQRQMMGAELDEEPAPITTAPPLGARRISRITSPVHSVSQSFLGTSLTSSYL